ncbi:MAG: hypothetical protein EOO73_29550 [Myxococcales bacterium]|nr:MAG: hypothetical protein EOO73_29550 [Myxococcales bacterium]
MHYLRLSAVTAVLLTAGASLAACSRASTPPPSSDAAVVPAPSPASPPESAPASPQASAPASPQASAPASAPAPSASPSDCASSDSDPRARATCEAKEEFRAFVAAHQGCSAASECTVVTGSCPFGCFVPVTKASRAETLAKLGALGERLEKAGHRCVYRCMSPPTEACVDGRCSLAAK